MKYRFEFTKKFQKQVQKLDSKTRIQIKFIIDKFIKNPDLCDWIKIKGHDYLYRIRSGDYRIIFEKQNYNNVDFIKILFLEVKHRKEVYKDY